MELEPNRKLFHDHLPSILRGAMWPLLSIFGGGSFTGIQKCGLSGPFQKLEGSFFCFALFCESEVECRWVQHTPPCDVEI
jgi:hypothetical protein